MGLGNHRGVRALHDLTRHEALDLLFLLETKLPIRKIEAIKQKISKQGCIGVDSEGKGGGLALMWKDHLDGHPDAAKRSKSWKLLDTLKPVDGFPWLVGRDFNEIVSFLKRNGGKQRPESQMASFRCMVESCHPQDLGFNGNIFTWCNGCEGSHSISERLDRFVANREWQSLNPT